MSAFEFVAAFFGIIVGLGVAQMLSSLSDLLEARQRVKPDFIQAVWAINILLLLIHSWWGMWALKAAPSWSYSAFLCNVAYLATTYLLSTLVFPRIRDEGPIDLAAHFLNVKAVFLYLLASALLFVVLINHVLFSEPVFSPFVAVPAVLIFAVIAGAHIKGRVYHGLLATAILGMELVIMVLDTTRIQ